MEPVYFGWSTEVRAMRIKNNLDATEKDKLIQRKLYIGQFGVLNHNPNLILKNLTSQRVFKPSNQEQPVEEQPAQL